MIQHIKTSALVVLIVGVSLTKSYAQNEYCADVTPAGQIAQTQADQTQNI
ncbi:hypothetical protein [Ruegeria sp. TM1040]|nr:hypothetical protein [Ruegeria sp. TM1040]